MVNIANVLSSGLLGNGVESTNRPGHTLELLVLHAIADGGIFLVLLGLACAVLAVALLVLYLVRAALIVLFVCAAPLLLLAHGLPQTEGLARLWWRAMLARARRAGRAGAHPRRGRPRVLRVGAAASWGSGQAASLIDLLLVLCLFYVLLRIPFWAKELVLSRRHASLYGSDGKDLCACTGS